MKLRYFVVVMVVMLVTLSGLALWNHEATALRGGEPNIIIIITDDQRADTMQTMDTVRHDIKNEGAEFTGLIPTSTCCPSRTSLLTGNNSHTTGVWSNKPKSGGWPTFHDSGDETKTIATALHDHGYTTGFFGKYLNYWNRSEDGFIPPGWDEFHALWQDSEGGPGAGAYYNYEMRGTDPPEVYGEEPEDYSTRVIGGKALEFIEAAEADDEPYLAFIATSSPHAQMRPDVMDRGLWQPKEKYMNDAVNEADVSDKPQYIQDLPKVDMKKVWQAQELTGQALISVDRMVEQVLDTADMSNTLIVYMGDNGYMWGEHRLGVKNWPYRWSTEVPLYMRWDAGLEPGDYGMATNVDVAATVLDAAGVMSAFSTEGQSVLDTSRRITVLEANEAKQRPGYCGVRTDRYMFVQYQTGERELYDYRVDPLELENAAGKAKYRAVEAQLRDKAIELCDPTPPEFVWLP